MQEGSHRRARTLSLIHIFKLKALEAFQKAADGKATKIIIPSEIQGLAGLAASAKTLLEDDKPEQNQ